MKHGKTIVELAADLAAGTITADWVKEQYGDTMLSSLLALTGGVVAGTLTHQALSVIDKETGLVSDLGSLVDDVLGL